MYQQHCSLCLLHDVSLQSVPSAISDMVVVENLHLVPPVAYIMPAAYVDYSVMKMTLTSEHGMVSMSSIRLFSSEVFALELF